MVQATLRSLAGRVTRRFLIPFRGKGSARIDARRRETRRCRRPLSLSLFLSPPPLSRTHNPWVEIARRNRAEEGGWMGGVDRSHWIVTVSFATSLFCRRRRGFCRDSPLKGSSALQQADKAEFFFLWAGEFDEEREEGFCSSLAGNWTRGCFVGLSMYVCGGGTREFLLAAESNFGWWIRICRVDLGRIWNRDDALFVYSWWSNEVDEFNLILR